MDKQTQQGAGDGVPVEEYIEKAEVGRRLSLRPRTINEWMKRGRLPYYKVGRTVRFKWSEIERHLGQTCRVCPGTSQTSRL